MSRRKKTIKVDLPEETYHDEDYGLTEEEMNMIDLEERKQYALANLKEEKPEYPDEIKISYLNPSKGKERQTKYEHCEDVKNDTEDDDDDVNTIWEHICYDKYGDKISINGEKLPENTPIEQLYDRTFLRYTFFLFGHPDFLRMIDIGNTILDEQTDNNRKEELKKELNKMASKKVIIKPDFDFASYITHIISVNHSKLHETLNDPIRKNSKEQLMLVLLDEEWLYKLPNKSKKLLIGLKNNRDILFEISKYLEPPKAWYLGGKRKTKNKNIKKNKKTKKNKQIKKMKKPK